MNPSHKTQSHVPNRSSEKKSSEIKFELEVEAFLVVKPFAEIVTLYPKCKRFVLTIPNYTCKELNQDYTVENGTIVSTKLI